MEKIDKEIIEIIESNREKYRIAIRVLLKFLTPEQKEDFLKNIKLV